MFVPNTVKNPGKPTKPLIPRSVKKAPVQPKPVKVKAAIDSDSDTDTEEIPIPDTFDDQMWEKVCGRPKQPPKPTVVEVDERATAADVLEEYSTAPEPEKPYDGLDNVAFKELVGKTKRPIGNIKLIDINEEEILPDRDIWLTKSLTGD